MMPMTSPTGFNIRKHVACGKENFHKRFSHPQPNRKTISVTKQSHTGTVNVKRRHYKYNTRAMHVALLNVLLMALLCSFVDAAQVDDVSYQGHIITDNKTLAKHRKRARHYLEGLSDDGRNFVKTHQSLTNALWKTSPKKSKGCSCFGSSRYIGEETAKFSKTYTVNKDAKAQGSGYVWVFDAERDGRRYAVKKFDKKLAVKQYAKRCPHRENLAFSSIAREIAVMASLEHPYIVRISEVFEDKEHVYLEMDHCNGGTWKHYMLKVLFTKQEREQTHLLNKYVIQLLTAVEYMHNIGIKHLDLKHDNLMMHYRDGDKTKDPILKVIDFGFASQSRNDMRNLGTPGFRAPETLDTKARLTKKTDVFAIGGIIYTLLTCGYILRTERTEDDGKPWEQELMKKNWQTIAAVESDMENWEKDTKQHYNGLQNDRNFLFGVAKYPELKRFLARCFVVENERPSVTELLEHWKETEIYKAATVTPSQICRRMQALVPVNL